MAIKDEARNLKSFEWSVAVVAVVFAVSAISAFLYLRQNTPKTVVPETITPSNIRVLEKVDSDRNRLEVWHDDDRGVTCYVFGAGSKGSADCFVDRDLLGR